MRHLSLRPTLTNRSFRWVNDSGKAFDVVVMKAVQHVIVKESIRAPDGQGPLSWSGESRADQYRRSGREAFRCPGHCACPGRKHQGRWNPARERLRDYVGHRSPCGACPTARNQSSLETVETRYAPDAAEPLAAGRVREDEASVRCREENSPFGAHL